jgi:2-amino-4-hydroxy-6-hydroxymethyldihydropteridine diphosphokinase
LVNFAQARTLLLALGGNVAGLWGEPRDSLVRAIRALETEGLKVVRSSNFYMTEPLGAGRQPRYLNIVIMVEPGFAPGALLRLLKRVERRAGRKLAPPMHPRPLDIDILDYGGRRLDWPRSHRRERGRLILPHPELHTRAFVLVPLRDVAPFWRHPMLGVAARTLLARLSPAVRSGVRQALDSPACACDKAASGGRASDH